MVVDERNLLFIILSVVLVAVVLFNFYGSDIRIGAASKLYDEFIKLIEANEELEEFVNKYLLDPSIDWTEPGDPLGKTPLGSTDPLKVGYIRETMEKNECVQQSLNRADRMASNLGGNVPAIKKQLYARAILDSLLEEDVLAARRFLENRLKVLNLLNKLSDQDFLEYLSRNVPEELASNPQFKIENLLDIKKAKGGWKPVIGEIIKESEERLDIIRKAQLSVKGDLSGWLGVKRYFTNKADDIARLGASKFIKGSLLSIFGGIICDICIKQALGSPPPLTEEETIPPPITPPIIEDDEPIFPPPEEVN